ncbi:tetraacyldisaccharide 4'-kinase [Maribacter halichondriae]|uniref:tetraacyldisaccharide 4'-kinase n=1 Tax=Maribacter halichondriae TaxID=2980554 RepID=UPI0023590548|nr:tetraacyldisaccharide 4'-kinase [Maribacter sp. Hal144]
MRPSKIKYYIFVAVQLLRKIAFPISLIYGLVVLVRNYLYNIGLFKSRSFDTPIICIGNLSVGGTGKTPMVEFLISFLKEDYKVAVLSRGYKRKSKGFALASTESTVEELGDEPYQIHSKSPEVIVAVDANRRNGISILQEKVKPDLILLDDAFQHRKVKPICSILLTSFNNLYSDDWYLPTGNLRDSKQEAKRADFIIVTKCPPSLSENERQSILKKLKPQSHQKVIFSYLVYDKSPLDAMLNKRFTLVTGIADSSPLVSFLKAEGLDFEHLRFSDHHFFTEEEIQILKGKEHVLTTEKDYVRLQGKVSNLSFIGVKHAFLGEGEQDLIKNLNGFMKQRR